MAFGSPVRIALSSRPSNLDPFFATDGNSQNINRLLHLSLVDFDSSMEFVCRLCKKFEQEIKNGKHIITFYLKTGMRFWDGEEITAKDVARSVELFTSKDFIKSIFRFAFSKIKQVNILGRYKLALVYERFDLENLSNLVLLKIIKYKKSDYHEISNIIGSGEYKIFENKPLEINLKPVFDRSLCELSFKIIRDETTLALKLINGEIDLSLSSISPRKIQWLFEHSADLDFISIPSSNYTYLSINHEREYLKNRAIRKAISHLIPRESLLKYKLKNQAILSRGLFSPTFSSLHEDLPIDEYSPEKAKKLIKGLGYKVNHRGFFEKAGLELSLDWKTNNQLFTIELVKIIKNVFEKNGIRVKVTSLEWGTFMRSFKNGDFDLVLGKWMGFTGPDMLNFVFHSSRVPPKGGNRGRYRNKQMDRLLESALGEVSIKQKNNLYKKAQRLANEDYSYINLWHPKITWIKKKCLSSIAPSGNGSFLPLLKLKNRCIYE
jgi:peptide/nickel transport system substrate-binding protein